MLALDFCYITMQLLVGLEGTFTLHSIYLHILSFFQRAKPPVWNCFFKSFLKSLKLVLPVISLCRFTVMGLLWFPGDYAWGSWA